MFCAAGQQTQAVLQQLSPLFSALRNAGQNTALSLQSRTCCQTPGTPSSSVDPPLNLLSMKRMLRELGFTDINTKAVNDILSRMNVIPEPSAGPYVSAQSFFENKNGFPQSLLDGGRFREISNGPAMQISLASMAHNLTPHSVQRQQIRGFKTKRAPVKDQAFSPKRIMDSMSSLKSSAAESRTKGAPEARTTSDSEKTYNEAFADGFFAHSKRTNVYLKIFRSLGLLVLIGVTLYAFSANSLSNMRLDVMRGGQFEVNPEEITVTFDDVKGVDEAKSELEDVVEFLRDPEKFQALGAKLPKGVLLVGPPGVGKTLLARAVAGEAGVPFFFASGSEFDEIFVGTGAKRVRQLFTAAKEKAPCVIFIDEMDTVGHTRSNSVAHPYANQTINQLLSEMDGFSQNEGVIVLGATNIKKHLDKALTRPGRFDVEVGVGLPDLKGRVEILELYMEKVKTSVEIDIENLAMRARGFTGADLKNMVNQAALKAALEEDTCVRMQHMNYAMDKIIMGLSKKNKFPDEETNRNTAYHEAGHTLVAYYNNDAHEIHKVTILPVADKALGYTSFIPKKELADRTRAELLASMDVSMGGRIAEELIFGTSKTTSGASGDFQTATDVATAMVMSFGMSEKVGTRVFRDKQDMSPAMAAIVDEEIKRLLQESYDRAKHIIQTHQKELDALANALLQYETLDVADVKVIFSGKKLVKPVHSKAKNPTTASDKPSKATSRNNGKIPTAL